MKNNYQSKERKSSHKFEVVRGQDLLLRVPMAEPWAETQAQVEKLTGQAGLQILRAILENEVTRRVGRLECYPVLDRAECRISPSPHTARLSFEWFGFANTGTIPIVTESLLRPCVRPDVEKGRGCREIGSGQLTNPRKNNEIFAPRSIASDPCYVCRKRGSPESHSR